MPASIATVGFSAANANLRHSPAVWAPCQGGIERALAGHGALCHHDNFISAPRMNAGSVVTGSRYAAFSDTGCGIRPAKIRGGAMLFDHDGTAQDECILQLPNSGASFGVHTTDPTLLIFECAFKKASIADNALGHFIGLGEEAFGVASGDALVDTTLAVADKDFIGFSTLIDGDAVGFVYKKAGQTLQTVATITGVFAADTWVRLAFVFDPKSRNVNQRIKWFINGVEQSTYVTQAMIEAATFPAGELMTPVCATKNVTAAATTAHLRFWTTWQLETAA